MKKSTLAILSAIAIATAHGDHGVESVTKGESILWLQSELNLSNDTYREASGKIKTFKESCKKGEFKALKDSITTEMTKAEPATKKIKTWNKELGELSQAKAESYTAHLLDLKTTLSAEEFEAFIAVSGKVYMHGKKGACAVKPHSHGAHATEHSHQDGSTHAHDHDHNGDHSHSHGIHIDEHTHVDGTVHEHKHDHTGDHEHSHTDATEAHATEHSHEDGTVHAHDHDHSGDHAHSHDTHASEHSHKDGTVHAHDHDHSGDHAHSHDSHASEHSHKDGTVHAHDHEHSGDHDHSHSSKAHSHEDGKSHSH